MDVTPDLLAKILRYDRSTGEIFWRERPEDMFSTGGNGAKANSMTWNARYAGRQTCCTASEKGYMKATILGKTMWAHRVAWALATGSWPKMQIDHINGDRSDNRFENLRDVSSHENSKNQKRKSTNKSGITGVRLDADSGKWVAEIWHNMKAIRIGSFPSKKEAVLARKLAEKEHGFHENHGR